MRIETVWMDQNNDRSFLALDLESEIQSSGQKQRFMGGTAAFFDPNQAYKGDDSSGSKIGFGTHLTDGAKGIPAVILAQYILESFSKGFHAPWFNLKDLLITAGTKAITRPVVGFVYDYLPRNVQQSLEVLEQLFIRQREKSTLKSDKKSGD